MRRFWCLVLVVLYESLGVVWFVGLVCRVCCCAASRSGGVSCWSGWSAMGVRVAAPAVERGGSGSGQGRVAAAIAGGGTVAARGGSRKAPVARACEIGGADGFTFRRCTAERLATNSCPSRPGRRHERCPTLLLGRGSHRHRSGRGRIYSRLSLASVAAYDQTPHRDHPGADPMTDATTAATPGTSPRPRRGHTPRRPMKNPGFWAHPAE